MQLCGTLAGLNGVADMSPKILAFAGSTRTHSHNKRLIATGARAVEAAGGKVTVIDLRDYPMPLYDGDLEVQGGLPEKARELKQLMVEHHGFLISCPEYNSSITAVLKNAIDWASRAQPNEAPTNAFKGKWAALIAASPGNLGGLRGLFTVRQILNTLGVIVLPGQLAVARAQDAFAEDGNLKDAGQQATLVGLAADLVRYGGWASQ
jgi:chromate reductase, NAD(P)H dehydrogenase (quinone)